MIAPKPSRCREMDDSQNCRRVEAAMKTENMKDVRQVSDDFIGTASDFYQVPQCSIRVLAARPLRVREHSTTETLRRLSPCYHADSCLDEDSCSQRHHFVWNNHLDFLKFGFGDSWHTRGFYERTATLYHQARGTSPKKLIWAPVPRQALAH
jgi:hypothetical protein